MRQSSDQFYMTDLLAELVLVSIMSGYHNLFAVAQTSTENFRQEV